MLIVVVPKMSVAFIGFAFYLLFAGLLQGSFCLLGSAVHAWQNLRLVGGEGGGSLQWNMMDGHIYL